MSTTTDSPRKVIRAALAVARKALPEYAHRYSPRKFTQHQLFACLALKTFECKTYRGVEALLADWPSLRRLIGLKAVPHYTTLQKASRRLIQARATRALLDITVRLVMRRRKRVPLAAVDSSGFESTHASRYYVWRAKRMGTPPKHMTYCRFPKLGVICNTKTHLILAAFPTRGPTPDVHQLEATLKHRASHVHIEHLLADAGYDSEANHVLLREEYGIRSTIPPKAGRPTKNGKLPGGHYRRLMSQRFDHAAYAQRSQVETVFSMLKRKLDACLRARTYWSQCREMILKVLTHNLMILLRKAEVFYRAGRS